MNWTPKNWGGEVLIHNGDYCMKLLVYTKQLASSLHFHERKHESFFIASGEFEIEIAEARPALYGPGGFIVLKPGTTHRVRCIEPGTIVEASTKDDPEDCVRIVPSET